MIGVLLRRVGAVSHRHAVGAREVPEVVVKPVILFDHDDHVLDRRRRRQLDARSLLVGPLELHGPGAHLLGLPCADVADFPFASSYQPWPGTGSVTASQSSCELVDVSASSTGRPPAQPAHPGYGITA